MYWLFCFEPALFSQVPVIRDTAIIIVRLNPQREHNIYFNALAFPQLLSARYELQHNQTFGLGLALCVSVCVSVFVRVFRVTVRVFRARVLRVGFFFNFIFYG